MTIAQWPSREQPREKLIQQGADKLSDAELLAIFLRTGVKGLSAVDLAQQLIIDFGSLRNILNASAKQFCKHHGVGMAKYAQLQAVMEIARRHLSENLKRHDILNSPYQTKEYLQSKLRDLEHEVFGCLMLDNRNRVIVFREMFRGTIDSAGVYPREVVKQALADNAAAVILAHNHPSGVSEPSESDVLITKRLKAALALVDIRVLDHIIVGDEVTCMAELGMV